LKIKVLGSGCKKCVNLEENVRQALDQLGKTADLEKVEDMIEISNYNVLKTPALVIDEKVVSSGKVNSVEEIKTFLD
jgi:small redox-active disulfide protein 2